MKKCFFFTEILVFIGGEMSFFIVGSGDLIELGIGEPLAVDIGVWRAKKFIRFCERYRSRMALISVFNVEDDSGEIVVEDVGEVVDDVRDGVRDRIVLVGFVVDWTVDRGFVLDTDGSRVAFDGGTICVDGGFTRWEITDDDDDELTLTVDVGLIDRLREAIVDEWYWCRPDEVGRGMKPKRVCILVGGGARFVIEIGLVGTENVFK